MTPELQLRYDALAQDRQECILPMFENLLTTVENHGSAVMLADPSNNGRAFMLSVGDVHFVAQLLTNGAEAYDTMFNTEQNGVTKQ